MPPLEQYCYYLVYRYLRHIKGAYFGRRWIEAKIEWRRLNRGVWRCSGCKERIKHRRDLTVDHIIPVWLIVDLELTELMFDQRNLQPMCHECNRLKDGTLEFLPESVRAKLVTMYLERHRTVQIQYVVRDPIAIVDPLKHNHD